MSKQLLALEGVITAVEQNPHAYLAGVIDAQEGRKNRFIEGRAGVAYSIGIVDVNLGRVR